MATSIVSKGISGIEDNLLDLRALVKFGLFLIENTDKSEFGEHKSEFCTLMYLLQEKIDKAYDTSGEIEVVSRASDFQQETQH